MLLETVITGGIELLEWQQEVMEFAHLNRPWNNACGSRLLSGYLVWRYHDQRDSLALVAAKWVVSYGKGVDNQSGQSDQS